MGARESIADREDELDMLEAPAERLEQEGRVEALREEQLRDASGDYFAIVSAMSRAFDGAERIDDEAVRHLSDAQQDALRLFQEAVQGRHGARLVLAEDRLAALGQALAVLQPVLAVGLDPYIPHALESFHALVDSVEALREALVSLEDAQEEMFEQDRVHDEARPPRPPDEGDEGDEGDAGERPSTLTGAPGEPALEQPAVPSTLYGADDEPAIERPVVPSTAYDGDTG